MKTKSVKIYKQGSSKVLKLEETDIPTLKPNDVLIQHHYFGLNYIDISQRSGSYNIRELPTNVGMEASGIIKEIGSEVKRFKVGDKVTHCMNLGSFTEYFVLNENRIVKLKENTDLKLAAASTLQGLTAQYLTQKTWKVKSNHCVLIHAASGGVGQILTQWCKIIGANVIGTVGNENKATIAKNNGCDFVINYSKENFEKKVNEYTNKNGADIIYDAVGKETFEKGLSCLAKRGRIVSYGISSGKISPIDINKLRPLSASIATGGLLEYTKNVKELQKNADDLFNLINKSKINIQIHKEYILDDIQEAHLELEQRKSIGKIILKMG